MRPQWLQEVWRRLAQAASPTSFLFKPVFLFLLVIKTFVFELICFGLVFLCSSFAEAPAGSLQFSLPSIPSPWEPEQAGQHLTEFGL